MKSMVFGSFFQWGRISDGELASTLAPPLVKHK